MKRLNKEFKLENINNISGKYGSVNKDNPEVIYITTKCWVKCDYDSDYNEMFENIKKVFKHDIIKWTSASNVFSNKTIIDFDINSEKMKKDEKKFLSVNVFLRQIRKPIYELKNSYFNNLIDIVYFLNNRLIENGLEIIK